MRMKKRKRKMRTSRRGWLSDARLIGLLLCVWKGLQDGCCASHGLTLDGGFMLYWQPAIALCACGLDYQIMSRTRHTLTCMFRTLSPNRNRNHIDLRGRRKCLSQRWRGPDERSSSRKTRPRNAKITTVDIRLRLRPRLPESLRETSPKTNCPHLCPPTSGKKKAETIKARPPSP